MFSICIFMFQDKLHNIANIVNNAQLLFNPFVLIKPYLRKAFGVSGISDLYYFGKLVMTLTHIRLSFHLHSFV